MAHKRSSSRSAMKPSSSAATHGASTKAAATTSRAMGSGAPRARTAPTTPAAARAESARGESPRPLSITELVRAHPWLVGLTVAVIVATALYAIVTSTLPGTPTPLAAGKAAPNFTLTAADGNQYSLSQYRGKVVVLEFFAPWCPHCRNETTVLNQVAHAYAGQDVQVLSVTATPYGYNYESTGDTTPIAMKDVKEFVTNFHVTYPAMLDTSLKAASDYGVAYFPQMFVIDRNGTITWNNGSSGEEAYSVLQSQIQHAQAVPLKASSATTPSK